MMLGTLDPKGKGVMSSGRVGKDVVSIRDGSVKK
jgi:hypothetical protein